LSQNYPNPFNPVTAIKFSVPASGVVSLKVYSVLGAEIARLHNGYTNAGEHTAAFDASGLPSGIYLYRIVAPGFTRSRTMALIK